MTSNTTPSSYVASVANEYGTELAYGASANNDLHWSPSNSGEQWLQVCLGTDVDVGLFLLMARYDQAAWNLSWYIPASNDGTNFNVLYSGIADQGATEQTYYIFTSDIKA